MFKPITAFLDFIRIVIRRYRMQGLRTTVRWLYTVGIAKITGRVSLRYSQVTPEIYLGPQYGKRGMAHLRKSGITASVSMRAEFDSTKHGLAFKKHSYLPTIDNTPPSLEQLDEGVAFIQQIIDAKGIVYVHCGSGVGRSPTLVAAYLVKQGMSLDEAVTRIQAARPFVRILPDQRKRLEEYAVVVQAAKEAALSEAAD